jgi:hypothetical protein
VSHQCSRNRPLRKVGGELRKSKSPLAITESKAPANFWCASLRDKRGAMSKNTNLKGLTLFIARSVSNSVTSEGKRAAASTPMRIASSENTGDMIVENTSMMMVWRVGRKSDPQPPTSRDRRALSRDRLNLGDEMESTPVRHQLESVDNRMLNYPPTERSAA